MTLDLKIKVLPFHFFEILKSCLESFILFT